MMNNDSVQEVKADEVYRLKRLYRYYNKQLETCHISIYEKTLHTLNRIEKRINRIKEGTYVY